MLKTRQLKPKELQPLNEFENDFLEHIKTIDGVENIKIHEHALILDEPYSNQFETRKESSYLPDFSFEYKNQKYVIETKGYLVERSKDFKYRMVSKLYREEGIIFLVVYKYKKKSFNIDGWYTAKEYAKKKVSPWTMIEFKDIINGVQILPIEEITKRKKFISQAITETKQNKIAIQERKIKDIQRQIDFRRNKTNGALEKCRVAIRNAQNFIEKDFKVKMYTKVLNTQKTLLNTKIEALESFVNKKQKELKKVKEQLEKIQSK